MTGVEKRSIQKFLREKLSGSGKLHDNCSKFRNTTTAYERLSLAQLDNIRRLVHEEFEKFSKKPANQGSANQDTDTRYPTMAIIHKKLQDDPDLHLPNWSLTTTRNVLLSMGFKVLLDSSFSFNFIATITGCLVCY